MNFAELLILAVGLAMDALAVSVCKGLSSKRIKWQNAACAGLWFGVFQALMPLLGYFLGSTFKRWVEAFDHWIAFGLLLLIGANMIREAFGGENSENDDFGFKTMLPLAIATSIDALAVGVSPAMSSAKILPAITVIGLVTFLMSSVGVLAGHVIGERHGRTAQIVGGAILIIIGLKILLEDLGLIPF